MKYVQIGILLALVLVAALLGLNLLRDTRGVDPQPIPTAAATPVPEAETPAESADADVPAAAQPEPEVKSAPAAPEPKREAKPAPEQTVAARTVKPKPSPTPRPAAPAAQPKPAEVAPRPEPVVVDPPRSASSGESLPEPPVETASTAPMAPRYELMKPESAPESNPTVVAPPRTVTIPAGTILTIRTVQTLSSKSNAAGDTFSGTLDQPLVHEDLIIAERGARVEGKVVEVTESGRVKGVAAMSIQLTKINTSDGQTADLQTQPFTMEAEKSTKGDVTKVGIATGIGAALGAIFGGGRGAAIGAAAGGAAGTGTVLATKGKPAEIPSETRINFRLDQPLTLTEKINQ